MTTHNTKRYEKIVVIDKYIRSLPLKERYRIFLELGFRIEDSYLNIDDFIYQALLHDREYLISKLVESLAFNNTQIENVWEPFIFEYHRYPPYTESNSFRVRQLKEMDLYLCKNGTMTYSHFYEFLEQKGKFNALHELAKAELAKEKEGA